MSLVLTYNDVDITSKIDIDKCIHDTYAERHGDTLMLLFKDAKQLWDKWNPKHSDVVTIRSGNIKSGKTFVRGIEPMSGSYKLQTSSLPVGWDWSYSKSWEGITYLQLSKDIATRHGLSFKSYGIEDHKYRYLRQYDVNDFTFLQDLSVLEGNSFLIYDGSLVIYSEKYLEDQAPAGKIIVGNNSDLHFDAKQLYSECTVNNGTISYTYKRNCGYSLPFEKYLSFDIASQADAERYAENVLRYKNKAARSGYFYSKPLAEDYTSGSIIKLSVEAAPSFDGAAFITHIRHDFSTGKSKIFFRMIQED